MSEQQMLVCALLVAVLVFFAWGRWRYDVVALAAMFTVVVSGIVPSEQALQGFGHPAVITVAAVLVISRALRNSGIVDLIAARLTPYTEGTALHIIVLTGVVTLASGFMNNVGALALMLPVALATAAKRGRSPSILLMPLAFGSILGGLITMIGTPPNVIIATYRADLTGQPFAMFDFTAVGGVIALVGVLFIALGGWRLIPLRNAASSGGNAFEINDYIMEVRAVEGCRLIGERLGEIEKLSNEEVIPVGLVRGKDTYIHPAPWRTLRTGDLIIVRAEPASLKNLIDDYGLELVTGDASGLEVKDLRLVEATVTPGSLLEGRDSAYLRRRTQRTLSLIAMARQGQPIRSRLRRQHFRAGDVLLLQGDAETVGDAITELGLLPLAERDLSIAQPRRIGLALGIFAIAIAAGALAYVPMSIAFIGAIVAYVVFGILPARDLYRDIDWPVIVLLGSMISVGAALEVTGTTELIAGAIVGLTGTLPALIVLGLVLVVTMTLSDLVNNAATALVMAPISVSIAGRLEANPDAFLMAVALGASCAFLTPIGHQSNTLVMGPGGYRFGDYWRLGLPLEVLIVLVGVPMIALVWPL
jgi:di/tricarboxylate transporter